MDKISCVIKKVGGDRPPVPPVVAPLHAPNTKFLSTTQPPWKVTPYTHFGQIIIWP